MTVSELRDVHAAMGKTMPTWKHRRAGKGMKLFPESQSGLVKLICFAGFAMVVLNGLKIVPLIADLFAAGDGDDQMRLVQVRDFLAGQGWFDVRQYRVLPPEGISMHWSRYLDAGIAGMLTLAALVLPPA
jgi:hypothetical protein